MGLLVLVFSVGLGAFLGAFFLCGSSLTRYLYSLIMANRLWSDCVGTLWSISRKRMTDSIL